MGLDVGVIYGGQTRLHYNMIWLARVPPPLRAAPSALEERPRLLGVPGQTEASESLQCALDK
jgi:hypothetical protein